MASLVRSSASILSSSRFKTSFSCSASWERERESNYLMPSLSKSPFIEQKSKQQQVNLFKQRSLLQGSTSISINQEKQGNLQKQSIHQLISNRFEEEKKKRKKQPPQAAPSPPRLPPAPSFPQSTPSPGWSSCLPTCIESSCVIAFSLCIVFRFIYHILGWIFSPVNISAPRHRGGWLTGQYFAFCFLVILQATCTFKTDQA